MTYEDYLKRVIQDYGGCPTLLSREMWEAMQSFKPWHEVAAECADAVYEAGKKSVPA